jgi:hypothetical protein
MFNLFRKWKPASMKSSIDWFKENRCPICHEADGFYDGPSGGMSTNIQCANEKCGAWLNFTPLFEGHFILAGIRGTKLPEGEEVRC